MDVTELMGNEIFLYLVSGKNTFVARVDLARNCAWVNRLPWRLIWTTSISLMRRLKKPFAKPYLYKIAQA